MSSYDEHLISQAGGDGETFADRMARQSIDAKMAKHASEGKTNLNFLLAQAWDEGAQAQAAAYGMDMDTCSNPYREATK